MSWASILVVFLIYWSASAGGRPYLATQALSAPPAYGNKNDLPALGTRACFVTQLGSEHRDKLDARSIETSELVVDVKRDGSIGIAVWADTYPRSKAHFLIGGKRYSGDGDQYVTIPLGELVDEQVIQYTYTDWPHGRVHSGEDVLVGFKAAYDDCMVTMRP